MIALVWAEEQLGICPGCGLPTHETMHSDAEGAYTARPLVCHACATMTRAAETWSAPGHGLHWGVTADG